MVRCPNCHNELEQIKGKVKFCVQLSDEDITYCPNCHCMTKSIVKSRAKWICGKCGRDKTLSDVFQYECLDKEANRKK